MDEKDYLGKLLKLKERAEEDRYFAERDRELIAKLKQACGAEHEDTLRELARFRCPQCGTRLLPRPFQDVTIEVCPACRGAWLSKEKLEAVMLGKERRWVKSFLAELIHLIEHPYWEQHEAGATVGRERAEAAARAPERGGRGSDKAD